MQLEADTITTDFLVIGSGIAGLRAAIEMSAAGNTTARRGRGRKHSSTQRNSHYRGE